MSTGNAQWGQKGERGIGPEREAAQWPATTWRAISDRQTDADADADAEI